MPGGSPAHDVYAYFYPNMLYGLRSLAVGGAGLLWNPFQNCGQPFFAITGVGAAYPPNLFFLVLPHEVALRALLFTNLLIGGIGTYALGRELQLTGFGAVGAALAFVLGNAAYCLTTWEPVIQTPFIWMPVAMWCCERLIKRPTLRRALLLGVALGAGLLAGHPQFVLFTCQLAGLRLLWALLDGTERPHFPRALAGMSLAMLIMPLLAAVQFFPGLEVAGESLRSGPLVAHEIAPRGNLAWQQIAREIQSHSALAPFSIVAGVLAPAALFGAHRRVALFYALTGFLFLYLSLGEATTLGAYYFRTPLGQLFRMPMRFGFAAGLCISVLTGAAIEALAKGSWWALGAAAIALAGLRIWIGLLWPVDLWLAGALLGGGLLAAVLPAARVIGAAVLLGTLGLAAVVAPPRTIGRFLANDGPLLAHAALFERLRARVTPQERAQFAIAANDVGFGEKTAELFGIRSITDYETQMTRSYAEYLTMLRSGQQLRSLNRVYYPGPWNPSVVRWPLVDLAAVRYLVLDKSYVLPAALRQRFVAVDHDEGVYIHENPAALPRAYYVPQVAVVEDWTMRLARLAVGRDDPRRVAVVDVAPASGFVGVPGNQTTADARFVVDDPERVVLEVMAPERGFLFLADQYFPGWSATVNGQSAPILVGNHTFRLVEVPKGPSTVEFSYRPKWVWLGVATSVATALVIAGLLVVPRKSRSGSGWQVTATRRRDAAPG